MRIYRSEMFPNAYSTSCQGKEKVEGEEDKTITYYLSVGLPEGFYDNNKSFTANGNDYVDCEMFVRVQGVEYPAFMSSFRRKDGTACPKLVIYTKKSKNPQKTQTEQTPGLDIQADDLPFY